MPPHSAAYPTGGDPGAQKGHGAAGSTPRVQAALPPGRSDSPLPIRASLWVSVLSAENSPTSVCLWPPLPRPLSTAQETSAACRAPSVKPPFQGAGGSSDLPGSWLIHHVRLSGPFSFNEHLLSLTVCPCAALEGPRQTPGLLRNGTCGQTLTPPGAQEGLSRDQPHPQPHPCWG